MARLLALPILLLVTENKPNLQNIVQNALLGGVNAVQLRDKFASSSMLLEQAMIIRSIAIGATFVINDNIEAAAATAADGVQLPEKRSGEALDHKLIGNMLVGRSVHSLASALAATQEDTDYLLAGTIYPSNSHPGEPGQGVEFLRQVCEAVAPLPVIAIGGITPERVGACIAAGAAGVAVLSPIMRAADPRAVAQAYRIELDKAWSLRSTENR